VWTHWDDVRPFDLSWKNLIYGPGPKVIAFVLNAQINSVKTPDMLKLWGLISTAQCPLCSHKQCTLHHILVNCNFALNQGRYTWRHDSVLANLELALAKLVTEFNKKRPTPFAIDAKKSFHKCFVRSGVKTSRKKNNWKAQLLTIEVGARGLVGGSTFRAFLKLGFSLQGARNLTKTLSTVVARCSYAIYLGHKSPVWAHNSDLIIAEIAPASKDEIELEKKQALPLPPPPQQKKQTTKI
jgi:hypothetical protein